MTEGAAAQRSTIQMAPPRVIERAYDDPEEVRRLIEAGAPCKSITAVQKEPVGTGGRENLTAGSRLLMLQGRQGSE
ncbi:MAG: hypothetical protein EP301_12340 [Gammaproteobacteria bacterium]|jgi:hypothetical protein|nr:MAG: hypothetical protein EP301_12340 [Gammaproteobacteria bacterium]